ncbi:hypothetical protein F5Y10DRAFT_248313 [Nemania abortiva]|nr:hypothetical protein F5Y10DRAFT_248313 [Nemania abortiva]
MELGADSGPMSQMERTAGHDNASGPTVQTKESKTKKQSSLRLRKTPIWLLILYLPTLIVPWVLLVAASRRVLPTYASSTMAVLAARVLNSINGVLVVPVILILLAHAAVVYAIRNQHGQEPTEQQLFALADEGGWSRVRLIYTERTQRKGGRFLWLAALLIFLGALLQPLMTGLVSFEPVAVRTGQDDPLGGRYGLNRANVVGYDPEPADMPLVRRDLILRDVLGGLATVSDYGPQPNMWPLNASSKSLAGNPLNGRTLFFYDPEFNYARDNDGFFVTAVDSGIDTGVLREHALRLNTSIQCEHIERSAFPSPCPGEQPFETQVARSGLELNVCAPGNSSQFPFSASRNRQDIVEEIFIDLLISSQTQFDSSADNYTLHCTASTSRGYFELPSDQNGHVPGPLLDQWPSPQYIWNETSDFRGIDAHHDRPTVEDPAPEGLFGFRSAGMPFGSGYSSTPGPLMVSAQVLFGNYSFVQILADNATSMTPLQAYASVCEHGSIPFSQATYLDVPQPPLGRCFNAAGYVRTAGNNSLFNHVESLDLYLTSILASHVSTFNYTLSAEYAFKISTYLANRAILLNTVSNEETTGARSIYSSPGSIFLMPIVNTPTLVVITILIGLQIIGLALLAGYIYSVPAWTSTLDALAVAQIRKALPFSPFTHWADLDQATAGDEKQSLAAGKGGQAVEGNAQDKDNVSIRN